MMALVKAFLDKPSDKEVPYFAASNMASKNKEEHLREILVANEIAVTILAMFSGNNGSSANFSFCSGVGVNIIVRYVWEKKKGKGKREENYIIYSHFQICTPQSIATQLLHILYMEKVT